jgi:hypothetical protein
VRAPVLWASDFYKDFPLQTDASNIRLGSVLTQHDDDGEHPIVYKSRKLIAAERNFSTVEKEVLALKCGIESFSFYLHGRK